MLNKQEKRYTSLGASALNLGSRVACSLELPPQPEYRQSP